MRAAAAGTLVAAALALAGGCRDGNDASPSPTRTTDESFRLYTHCGVLSAKFAGRRWRADPPLTDGSGNPPPGWGNPFEVGEMTLLQRDVAEYRGPAGHRARFVPLAADEPDPATGCA